MNMFIESLEFMGLGFVIGAAGVLLILLKLGRL